MKIVAIDNSGSTQTSEIYWSKVQTILRENEGSGAASDPGVEFYLWGTSITPLKKTGGVYAINRGEHGGTSPSRIVGLLTTLASKKINVDSLVLVTDGEIGHDEVEICHTLISTANPRLTLKECSLYLVNRNNIDLSVIIPFAIAPKTLIYINDNLVFGGDVQNLNVNEITLENILNNFDDIAKRIQLKNMGVRNEEMKQELVKLKGKWLHEFSLEETKKNDVDACMSSENEKELKENLKRMILSLSSGNTRVELSKKIDRLISFCDMNRNYKLAEPSRVTNASITPVVSLPEEIEALEFMCPITLDDDVPCLLINAGLPSFFSSLEKDTVEEIINCPLYLTTMDNVFSQYVDHVVGCSTFKSLLVSGSRPNRVLEGNAVSPFTRNPILGCIPLGCDPQHIKVGNSTLSRFLSNGKLPGNPTLYLAAMYLALVSSREKEGSLKYLSSNLEFMEAFKKHIIYRLKNLTTNIALSGAVDHPMVNVPIVLALYYCMNSKDFLPSQNVGIGRKNERLKQFHYYSNAFLDLLKLCSKPETNPFWTVEMENIVKKRALYIKTVFIMLSLYKKDRTVFLSKVRTLYQNYIVVSNAAGSEQIIFLDGPSPPENGLLTFSSCPNGVKFSTEAVSLSNEETFGLSQLISDTRIGDISIPDVFAPLPQPEQNYSSYPTFDKSKLGMICRRTLRPYLIDPRDGLPFEQRCARITNTVHKFLPLCNYYADFVTGNGRYPGKNEFLLYVWRIVSNREVNPVGTLPSQIIEIINLILGDYAEITEELPAKEAGEILLASRDRENRKRMEALN